MFNPFGGMWSALKGIPGLAQQVPGKIYDEASGAVGGAKDWFNDKNAPQINQNPYLGQWGGLIQQLQAQSMGKGPSLAGQAYKDAHQRGMQGVMSISRGGSAGAVRAGQQAMGQMNQGLANGYSNARLQEQLAARQMLTGALTGAGNAWFAPQQANLNANMNTQSNGQQLMNFLAQLTTVGAQAGVFGSQPKKPGA